MDLIADFAALTAAKGTPLIYRKWAGVGLVSAALSRKVWTTTLDNAQTFGNMNIMLVGDPAQGKSLTLGPVRALLEPFAAEDRVRLAPSITTLPALEQDMGRYFNPKVADWPRSYIIVADELGALFKEWDSELMQTLAALWDNNPKFNKFTKTQGRDMMTAPYIGMLAGAQPQWLADAFPKGAFKTGLPSRFIFVYSDEKRKISFSYDKPRTDFRDAYEPLREPLARVMDAKGFAEFDDDAWREYQDWRAAGEKPVPTDEMLQHYRYRRAEHVGKLALVIAMSRHPDHMAVTRADLHAAWELLFETEVGMGNALALAGGGNPIWPHQAMLLETVREAGGKGVPEGLLRSKLVRLVQPRDIGSTIDALVDAKLLKPVVPSVKPPQRLFVLGSAAQ